MNFKLTFVALAARSLCQQIYIEAELKRRSARTKAVHQG
jgi:hypothetical protein